MVTKWRNKLYSNKKLLKILEKSCIFIFILIFVLLYMFSNLFYKCAATKKDLTKYKKSLIVEKQKLNQIKTYSPENYGYKLNYSNWIKYYAKPVNLFIYTKTNNLKILNTTSQNELNKISKNFNLNIRNYNYNNFVKFLIVNKTNKRFITNDISNLKNIQNTINTNNYYNFVYTKGVLYNLSYDSIQAPAKNYSTAIDSNVLQNTSDYIEAYWLPNDYVYSKNDYNLNSASLEQYKISISNSCNEFSKRIEYLNNNLKITIIKLSILVLGIIVIIAFIFIFGIKHFFISLKSSFTGKYIIKFIYLFDNAPTLLKLFIYFILTIFLIAIFLIFNKHRLRSKTIFVLYLIFYFLFIFRKIITSSFYLDKIVSGTNKITSGDINFSIPEKGDKKLENLAKNINKINKGFKISIEDQIKNEKLKSELVANVSHDLKTPLTSIINSADILLKQDISPEEKEEYLNILYRKSLKLKKLIEDLFEISKINSGKMDLNKTNLNIIELIHQSIGEYTDTEIYENKNLNFIVNSPKDNIELYLDGNKMSRVFENVITNILKYSLENTRVYIDINDLEDCTQIIFKNISKAPLDFDKSEIFERFSRGDNSRDSKIEGSGLGLNIAKSIVELHNGKMYIDFDGDLFKCTIKLFKIN